MVHVIKFYVHEIIKYSNKINEMLLFLRVSRVFFFVYRGGLWEVRVTVILM